VCRWPALVHETSAFPFASTRSAGRSALEVTTIEAAADGATASIGGLRPGDAGLPVAFMAGFRDALLTGGIVAIAGGLVGALSVSSRRANSAAVD
jgi:hypothetical protein